MVDLKTQQFIEKAKLIHGEKYSYRNAIYLGSKEKIEILCIEHGLFWQEPRNHLAGFGCKKCGYNNVSKNLEYSLEEFISKSNTIHNNKYDYKYVIYSGSKNKVKIICPTHGEFLQTPASHMVGKGCYKCGKTNMSDKLRYTTNTFANKAIEKHGGKYKYSKSCYRDSKEKIEIICERHGSFWQIPKSHLEGMGCPRCSVTISKPHQKIIDFLTSKNIEFSVNNKEILDGLELDIYVPSKKLAIEVDGVYFHSSKFKDKYYHYNKHEECKKLGINLVRLLDYEIEEKEDLVLSMISNALGLIENKIYARKCSIKEISTKEYSTFLNENHLEGSRNSKIKLGLFYEDTLISTMGFTKYKKVWELERFCSSKNTQIIGAFSKLLKHFIKRYNPQTVKTFSFNRYSSGNLYNKNGFSLSHINKANLYYTDGIKLFNRQKFMKSKLKKLIENPNKDSMSEIELAAEVGHYQFWDAGTTCWVLEPKLAR